MAKLIRFKEHNTKQITLAFIPGGPGLSSISFRPLKPLAEFFNVVLVDPAGTGGTESIPNPNYAALLDDLQAALSGIENLYLCGHSFGGIQAADLICSGKIPAKGLICLATPISNLALQTINNNFEKHLTTKHRHSSVEFDSNPTDKGFAKWFSNLSELYFSPEHVQKGKDMLQNDLTAVSNFLMARKEAVGKEFLLDQLNFLNIQKIFIAGEAEILFPLEIARNDASRGNFNFVSIGGCAHFVHFEDPKSTCEIIKNFIFKGGNKL